MTRMFDSFYMRNVDHVNKQIRRMDVKRFLFLVKQITNLKMSEGVFKTHTQTRLELVGRAGQETRD